jgi:hypothetical protein
MLSTVCLRADMVNEGTVRNRELIQDEFRA